MTRRISDRLSVYEGVVNVGILNGADGALLIDCASGAAEASGPASRILFTHAHRDQTTGLEEFPVRPQICVPAEERELFENADQRWAVPENRWRLYNDRPTPPLLTEAIPVDAAFQDGDRVEWGGAQIAAVSTPGHTDGGMSYLVETDAVRAAFTGDLIAGPGQVWDVHSMQKRVSFLPDYHGFLGTQWELAESLRRVLEWRPDILIPSHGQPIENPVEAVELLLNRLNRCYDRYVAASALRHYFPEMFVEFENADDHMPFGETLDVPPFLRHIGTSWIVLSESGEAFVMDCGSPPVVETLDQWIQNGEISDVTGFWITHYHDDHVEAVPQFQRRFNAPTGTVQIVADIVQRPTDWRIPCLSDAQARVDYIPAEGASWRWNEFWMTAYFFPGQTYYHGGLLVEGRGMRLFFTGDSFTPSGMDDYCAANRNLLGEGVGLDRCVALLQKLQPTHLFNCHVENPFRFNDAQLQFMRDVLRERETLFGELVPWDHANYGLDPHWVRCDPYSQSVSREEHATVRVEITNHSSDISETTCQPVLPAAWGVNIPAQTIRTPANAVGSAAFRIPIPADAEAGLAAVPFNIVHRGRNLGPFREAILEIRPA